MQMLLAFAQILHFTNSDVFPLLKLTAAPDLIQLMQVV